MIQLCSKTSQKINVITNRFQASHGALALKTLQKLHHQKLRKSLPRQRMSNSGIAKKHHQENALRRMSRNALVRVKTQMKPEDYIVTH